MSASRSLLSSKEVDNNLSFLTKLQTEALSVYPHLIPDVHLQKILHFFQHFMSEHHIALQDNLVGAGVGKKDERKALLNIMLLSLKGQFSSDAISTKLIHWKKSLHHAVYGLGKHVALHNSVSSGFVSELLQAGQVPLQAWGTDLDVNQCLKHHLTDARTIQTGGTYVLASVSLTASPVFLRDRVEEACVAISQQALKEPVSLCIPVNCGNNHWRLAKVTIEAAKVVSAQLWDSMGNPQQAESFKSSAVYHSMETALRPLANKELMIEVSLTGKQKNTFSCIDFVIQEAYRSAHIVNAITDAGTDAMALRKAIVRQIVSNHPELGPVEAAALKFTRTAIKRSSSPMGELAQFDPETFLDVLQKDKALQISFDGILATHLQDLYDTSDESEEDIMNRAFRSARIAHGLFAHQPAVSADTSLVADSALHAHSTLKAKSLT